MGRIFSAFDQDVHVIDPSQKPIERRNTFGVTIDPHDRRPCAIAWWMVDPTGDITFIRNWPVESFPDLRSSDMTVPMYCEMFKRVEDEIFEQFRRTPDQGPIPKVLYRFMDPNFGSTLKMGTKSKQTVQQAFAENGYFFNIDINNSLEAGHEAVRDRLWYDKEKPRDALNAPKIFFYRDCGNIINSIDRYVWDEKRARLGLSEIPSEKWKDFCDVVRYTCIKKPMWLGEQVLTPRSPNLSEMRGVY